MSRYPSEGVARFDQQFAESEGERNERIRENRRRRIKSAPYGEMCRDPVLCAGKGYCPAAIRSMRCADSSLRRMYVSISSGAPWETSASVGVATKYTA